MPFAEWWYNTTDHYATQTTPYEALYGQPPPIHLPYLPGDVVDEQVDMSLIAREFKTQLLKHHLNQAQQRMISQANHHMSDRQFQVGDWVYLKIQPYRQFTLSTTHFSKLAAKYYGPYQIIQKIGAVAYKLSLPSNITIHLTFHVSLLKPCYKVPDNITHPPVMDITSPYCPTPKSIHDRRMIKKRNKVIAQVLV